MHTTSTLAIIGSGSLGSTVAKAVARQLSNNYKILGILSRKQENAVRLSQQSGGKAYDSLKELIADGPDYIVEAAAPDVLKEIALPILSHGINLIPLSCGALADAAFYQEISEAALHNNCRVYIPTGAVGGFDVLRAALLMGDANVRVTTEKPPASLNGAPILKGRLLSEDVEEEIFSGNAAVAISYFPKNVNVAVATALATTGVEHTQVVVKSIPGMKSNRHTIHLKGENVEITLRVEGKPSEVNPKSSTLAAYSVVSILQNLAAPIVF